MIKPEPLALDPLTRPAITKRQLFAEAFLLAATNPKALLFYVALFPQVISPEQDLLAQAGLLILTYCSLSILSLSLYATLAQVLRAQVLTQRRYDRFRQISGLVLIGFALALLAP